VICSRSDKSVAAAATAAAEKAASEAKWLRDNEENCPGRGREGGGGGGNRPGLQNDAAALYSVIKTSSLGPEL
jgi:hypothetical protein